MERTESIPTKIFKYNKLNCLAAQRTAEQHLTTAMSATASRIDNKLNNQQRKCWISDKSQFRLEGNEFYDFSRAQTVQSNPLYKANITRHCLPVDFW